MSFANIPRPIKKESGTKQSKLPVLSELDQRLLNDLYGLFTVEVQSFYINHDFNNAFLQDYWRPLSRFVDTWTDASHEFVDEEMELHRKRLYDSAYALASLISLYTVPIGDGRSSVRSRKDVSYDETREKRLRQEAKEINQMCEPFNKACEDFIRYSRKRLANY